ncbi:MAG: class I SAM-dependent methyltransferase [Chloroflexota bacterium]
MSERAHPDDSGFQDHWSIRWRRGFVPWPTVTRSPYRAAFFGRYRWASQYCKDKDVLDIPCGMGWGTSLIKGCRTLHGMDVAQDAIDEATERYGRRIHFQVGDMAKLEFEDENLDVVVCLEGIEHVPEAVGNAFLAESARVLRPQGTLLVSSPHCRTQEHSGNPFHLKEYKPEELTGMLNAHFTIAETMARDVDNLTISYFRAVRR